MKASIYRGVHFVVNVITSKIGGTQVNILLV